MENNTHFEGERIAKVLARSGLCSRREAERWIEAKRVKIDGQVITSPATNVTLASKIEVDNKLLPTAERTAERRLFLYNKPDGLITTHNDPQGRQTVFQSLPKDMPRVISVGRLDLTTEGLLLLTTDGELSRTLESPKTALKRTYRARVFGEFNPSRLKGLENGLTIHDPNTGEKMHFGRIDAEGYQQRNGKNFWLRISIYEGKNREIRRICEHLGLRVNRLIRTDYGPFELGSLPTGEVIELSAKVIEKQLKGIV